MTHHLTNNAFLTKTPEPDGRCLTSHILTKNGIIEKSQNASSHSKFMFVTPGINTNFRYMSGDIENQNNTPKHVMHYSNSEWSDDGIRGNGTFAGGDTTPVQWFVFGNKSNVVHWRLRASSVKINMKNAVDDRAGSYEACAIPLPMNPTWWKYSGAAGGAMWVLRGKSQTDYPGIIGPAEDMLPAWAEKINMKDYPSYRTGTLQELNDKVWTCPLHDTNQDFIDLGDNLVVGPYTEYLDPNAGVLVQHPMAMHRRQIRYCLNNVAGKSEIYNQFWDNAIKKMYDTSFLMWVIRIHRDEATDWTIEGKHTVEVMYGSDSPDLYLTQHHNLKNKESLAYATGEEAYDNAWSEITNPLNLEEEVIERGIDAYSTDVEVWKKEHPDASLPKQFINEAKIAARDIAEGTRDFVKGVEDAHTEKKRAHDAIVKARVDKFNELNEQNMQPAVAEPQAMATEEDEEEDAPRTPKRQKTKKTTVTPSPGPGKGRPKNDDDEDDDMIGDKGTGGPMRRKR